jgi:hypothetical protein
MWTNLEKGLALDGAYLGVTLFATAGFLWRRRLRGQEPWPDPWWIAYVFAFAWPVSAWGLVRDIVRLRRRREK